MSITHQLELFIDVVQQGSFAKAAALHDMDNSALSKQIKKLELVLGVQLLNRSTRSFSLTAAGEEILSQAHILRGTLQNVQAIADSYQSTPKGLIRITSAIFFGQQYLQPVISKFMKLYPEVKVTLILDDKRSDIIADHFDVAFRIGKLTTSNLIAKKIANTNFALVASHQFIEQYGLPSSPEGLLSLPAVIYSNGDVSLDSFDMSESPNSNVMKSYKMQGNYKVSDVRTMLDAVRDGLGYALIDLFNLEAPIESMGLTPMLTNYLLSTKETGIYAIYPHRKHTLLVKEFIKAVQEHIGEPAFWEQHISDYHLMYR
ncbi:LysR family transcriptional regulator [Vibrio methylphosphonaticus]|uniref:LysR family transcriptional regulator n=1 Tax=Vibrio methylphosphonaticus TaxID=2946866 RepID=UPI00202AB3D3|nr:LysR family transcriptional regulator [Vibrio methylphosphonaticus]MCL9773633.1 LysR family transcriptional regulator [Vibrio methylphosphonaticus]